MDELEIGWDDYDEFLEVIGLDLHSGFKAKLTDPHDDDKEESHELALVDPRFFCSVAAVRSILLGCIKLFGFGTMASVFRVAGAEYSRLRANQLMDKGVIKPGDIEGFLQWVAYDFENWGYGKVTVISISPSEILVKVDENMSASGMKPIGRSICYYEGGRITGGLSVVTNRDLAFLEIKCWGRGDDHCLFKITPSKEEDTIY